MSSALNTPVYRRLSAAAFSLSLCAAVLAVAPLAAHAQDAPPAATAAAPAPTAHDALLAAVAKGDVEGVRAAAAQGADLNKPGGEEYDTLPPLHLAVYLGHRDVAALLIEKGADTKAPGPQGWGVLSFAVFNHHATLKQMEQVKGMEAQANALMQKQMAEFQAHQAEAASALAALQSAGAPRRGGGGLFGALGRGIGGLFKGGGLGNIAMAVMTGGTSAIGQGLLQSVGADLGKQLLGKALGNSPLGNFATAVLSGNPISGATALDALAGGKGLGGLTDAAGWVNLVQSAVKGDASAVANLANLAPGAGGGDKASWGTFLTAAQRGQVAEVEQMIKSGKIDGYLKQSQEAVKGAFTAMDSMMKERAAKYKAAPADPAADAAMIRLLAEKGADVNAADPEMKCTPLMWAAQAGRADLVKALLEKGAKVNQKDASGQTALDWADNNVAASLASLSGEDDDKAPDNPAVAVLEKAGGKRGDN